VNFNQIDIGLQETRIQGKELLSESEEAFNHALLSIDGFQAWSEPL